MLSSAAALLIGLLNSLLNPLPVSDPEIKSVVDWVPDALDLLLTNEFPGRDKGDEGQPSLSGDMTGKGYRRA